MRQLFLVNKKKEVLLAKRSTLTFSLQNYLVQSVCKLSASLELSYLLSSNLDLSLSSGVDTLTCGTLANCECTETYESYLVTSNESTLNSCYSCIESLLCVNL